MSKAAGMVKRYRETVVRKSLTALQDYFAPEMEESEHGKYVLATDYDAVCAQLTAAQAAAAAATSSEERLREVLKHFTVRPNFHQNCDDYSRGYGDALAVVATQASNALSTHPSAREQGDGA